MSDLQFSHYANVMIKLDKAKYDSLKDDEKFKAASPEAKLKCFSKEFQDSIAALFKVGEAHAKSQGLLCVAVSNVIRITGCTLEEGSKIISLAFGKAFDRSYMSKLVKAGYVISINPTARAIGDVTKLADVSRLPESEQAKLFAEFDVATMPRNELNETVNARLGVETKEPKGMSKGTLVGYIKALEKMVKALPGDIAVGDAAQGLIDVLSERIQDLEETTASAFTQVAPTIAPTRVARKVAKNRETSRQLPLMQRAR